MVDVIIFRGEHTVPYLIRSIQSQLRGGDTVRGFRVYHGVVVAVLITLDPHDKQQQQQQQQQATIFRPRQSPS